MTVDYDLVIVGDTPAARFAATRAAYLKARVALVEPDFAQKPTLECTYAMQRSMIQIARRASWRAHDRATGIWGIGSSSANERLPNWNEAWRYSKAIAANLEDDRSPAIAAAAGVDWITGEAEFVRRPHPGIVVNGRLLRSRRTLIAVGSRSVLPTIPGLDKVAISTPEEFWHGEERNRPERLLIIGGDASAVELAQMFSRFGSAVTLVMSDALLPEVDREAAHLLQCQLEAEGVQLFTQTEISQMRGLDGQIWAQIGNQAIPTDVVLMAAGRSPLLASLNLGAVNLPTDQRYLAINHKLQTSNPQIYAVGAAVGGFPNSDSAIDATRTALKNALFLPLFRYDSSTIPCTIATDPEIAWIGMTETQAREHYGDRVIFLRQPYKGIELAQMERSTTGFCKIIVQPNGQILGAHIIGAGAAEMIGTIALMMQHRLPIQTLMRLSFPATTYSEVLQQIGEQWALKWGDRHPRLLNWLEEWFDGLRSRSR